MLFEKITGAALLVGLLFVGGCAEPPGNTPGDSSPGVSSPGAPTAQASMAPPAVRLDTLPPDSATAARFQELMDYARAESLSARPIGAIVQAVGARFIGEPYVVGPLDQTSSEVLVCRLDGFDCFTFVEAALALARGIKQQDVSYAGYAQRTRAGRYRGGQMDGYCSRLHYFTEWIADNERRGVVKNVTQELGGERLDKTLDFMTTHRDRYPRFAEDDSLFACLQEMEERLAERPVYFIPQDHIRAAYDQLQAGDLLAMATDLGGLDVTHTGLAYKGEDGRVGLLHASTDGGVKVSPDLQSYVQNVEHQIGIVVTRPLNP